MNTSAPVVESAIVLSPARSRMERYARPLIALVTVLAILTFATPRIAYSLSHDTTDDAYVDVHPVIVSARESGTVTAVPISEGEHVRRGQLLVRLDETASRAEVSNARQAVRVAEASLAQARADVSSTQDDISAGAIRARAMAMQAGSEEQSHRIESLAANETASAAEDRIRGEQSAVDAAEASIPATLTKLGNAQRDLVRSNALERSGFVSLTQNEQAQSALAQLQAQLKGDVANVQTAKDELAALRSQAASEALMPGQDRAAAVAASFQRLAALSDLVANSPKKVESKRDYARLAEAQLFASREALRIAVYNLTHLTMKSPVDGYIASRPATVGETLNLGDAGVVIMPDQNLYVTANFRETQLEHIHPGSLADVHIDAYPSLAIQGTVSALGAGSQSALSLFPNAQVSGNFVKITQRVPIKIAIDSSALTAGTPLRAGMSAEVSVSH